MAAPIPEAWRKTVCRILRSGDRSRIDLKQRALNEWNATTNHAFMYELYNGLEDALRAPAVMGNRRVMREPGETYEFFFLHEKRTLYSKICLCPDDTLIIIYSAHPPTKEEL